MQSMIDLALLIPSQTPFDSAPSVCRVPRARYDLVQQQAWEEMKSLEMKHLESCCCVLGWVRLFCATLLTQSMIIFACSWHFLSANLGLWLWEPCLWYYPFYITLYMYEYPGDASCELVSTNVSPWNTGSLVASCAIHARCMKVMPCSLFFPSVLYPWSLLCPCQIEASHHIVPPGALPSVLVYMNAHVRLIISFHKWAPGIPATSET